MEGRHRPFGVVKQKGVAVRHPHPEEEARGAGEEAIPFPNPGAFHQVDLRAVYLFEPGHGGMAESREDPPLVLGHPFGVVPGGGGEVQALKGPLGHPTQAGGETMGHG